MKLKICIFCICLIICNCFSIAHGYIIETLTIEDPVELNVTDRSKNIADVIDSYKISAEKGNIDSQLALGKIYYYGYFKVPVNYSKALEWFEKAAALGNATAQYYVGYMYYTGRGTFQNFGHALKFFGLSSEKGNKYSLFYLGLMYYHGIYAKKDLDKSLEYFEKAAKKELVEAYYYTSLVSKVEI